MTNAIGRRGHMLVGIVILLTNTAVVLPQQQPQYYYYPQEFVYNPQQQQQFYYQQQQQQFQQQQPQQPQYFVQYFPQQQQFVAVSQFPAQQQQFIQLQQQQQFTQVQKQQQPQMPTPIYVENQQQPAAPQAQQQFVPQRSQRRPESSIIVVSMEATPPPARPASKVPFATSDQLEFDLPPPPPARFLPDKADKIRIADLLTEERQFEQQRAIQRQQQQLEQEKLNRQAQQQKSLLQQQQQILLQQQEQRIAQERQQNELIRQRQQKIEQEDRQRKAEVEKKKTVEKTQFSQDSAPVSHLSPDKADPNRVFLNCCKKKKVNKKCESRCNFDMLNKKILTQMFLGTDPCPQSNGLDLFICAAQESDHRQCCREKQVHRTAAGEKCLAFCNLTPNAHFQADASYLPCWAVLNDVKSCFKDAISANGEVIRAA